VTLARVEFVNGVVEGEEIVGAELRSPILVAERRVFPFVAAFGGLPPACVIDEHLTHRAGGDGKKVRAVAGMKGGAVGQLHICLVDERRRVHRTLPELTAKLASGDPAQVVVDKRDDAIHCLAIAAASCMKQARHLAPRCFCPVGVHGLLTG